MWIRSSLNAKDLLFAHKNLNEPAKSVNNVNWKKVQRWRYRFRRRKLTSETWVILFSQCLFFLIKASKKDNYQLENKKIKNWPLNLKKNHFSYERRPVSEDSVELCVALWWMMPHPQSWEPQMNSFNITVCFLTLRMEWTNSGQKPVTYVPLLIVTGLSPVFGQFLLFIE